MPRCAFLTLENTEGWFIDDDLVHEPLIARGWEVENVPWTRSTDWDDFDLVVIRSPWDYQQRPEEFLEVLGRIERSKAKLQNSLEVVRWNIDKTYLLELRGKGVELVPTVMLPCLGPGDLDRIGEEFGTRQLVVKPTVGANADDTFRLPEQQPGDVFAAKPCFVQPFMQSVVDEGEFSLMYFNGSLSHVILKTVGKGDFRVQEEHGGGVVAIDSPEPALVAAGDAAMAQLPWNTLYARVDLVRTDSGSFGLMELEMIEPCLYFRFGDNSAGAFAAAICDAVQG